MPGPSVVSVAARRPNHPPAPSGPCGTTGKMTPANQVRRVQGGDDHELSFLQKADGGRHSAGSCLAGIRAILVYGCADDHWAKDAVARLADRGLVETYPDGTFKGDRIASRLFVARIMALMLAGVEQAIADTNNPAALRGLRQIGGALNANLGRLGANMPASTISYGDPDIAPQIYQSKPMNCCGPCSAERKPSVPSTSWTLRHDMTRPRFSRPRRPNTGTT